LKADCFPSLREREHVIKSIRVAFLSTTSTMLLISGPKVPSARASPPGISQRLIQFISAQCRGDPKNDLGTDTGEITHGLAQTKVSWAGVSTPQSNLPLIATSLNQATTATILQSSVAVDHRPSKALNGGQ
jgi:hypothetical protein